MAADDRETTVLSVDGEGDSMGDGGSPDDGSFQDSRSIDTRSIIPPGIVVSREVIDRSLRGVDADGTKNLPSVPRDHYAVGAQLARGGMGRIMAAQDRRLGRVVAIKELLDANDTNAARFEREARITARLQHPAIVPVYEAGKWPGGEPFYAMKLVAGESFDKALVEASDLRARMALLPHVIAVAEALAYAHNERIIHRDLKPSNILIGEFGETVVIDWGLAKDLAARRSDEYPSLSRARPGERDDSDELADLTRAGAALGTPAYMAPEQARGEPVDTRADVYSLGAILYHLLSGTRVFPEAGSARSILQRLLEDAPRPLAEIAPEVPPELITIVAKAMARAPGARYPSARELVEDLKNFQTGQMVSAHDYSPWSLLARWIRRHRSAVIVASIAAVLLAAVLMVGLARIVDERDSAWSARATAERRTNELFLTQAEAALEFDPTAAVAWLKRAPLDDGSFTRARRLFDVAVARGVASRIIDIGALPMDLTLLPDGKRAVVVLGAGHAVLIDLASGEKKSLGLRGEGLLAAAPSPTADLVALGGHGSSLWLWNLADSTTREITVEADGIIRMTFSPDGRTLHARRFGGGLVAVDIARGIQTAVLSYPDESTALSPDGTHRARWSEEEGSRIEHIASATVVQQVAMTSRPKVAVLSPDNRLLALYGRDDRMRLVTIATGEVRDLGPVSAAAMQRIPVTFAPDGSKLASVGEHWSVRVWDLTSGETHTLAGHDKQVYEIHFSRQGTHVLSASDDGTARLWDLRTNDATVLRGHRDDVVEAAITDDGSQVVTASYDGTVRVWPLQSEPSVVLASARAPVEAVAFASEHEIVAVSAGAALHRWRLPADGLARRDEVEHAVIGSSGVAAGAKTYGFLSPDGRSAVTPGTDGPLLWNTGTGESRVSQGHATSLRTAAFTTDGSRVAIASWDRAITLHSLEPWRDDEPFTIKSEALPCGLALSPDGTEVAVATPSHVAVWSAVPRRFIASYPLPHPVQVCLLGWRRIAAYSPDGRWLAVGGQRGGLVLIRRSDGRVHPVDADNVNVTTMAFSRDGSRLAFASADRELHVVELRDGIAGIQQLGVHEDMILDLAFSPDGRLLASATHDRTIRLWTLESATYRVLRGHGDVVSGVAFSPSGRFLASSSYDRSVRLWNVEHDPIPDPDVLRGRLGVTTTAIIDDENNRPHSPGSSMRAPDEEPVKAAQLGDRGNDDLARH